LGRGICHRQKKNWAKFSVVGARGREGGRQLSRKKSVLSNIARKTLGITSSGPEGVQNLASRRRTDNTTEVAGKEKASLGMAEKK